MFITVRLLTGKFKIRIVQDKIIIVTCVYSYYSTILHSSYLNIINFFKNEKNVFKLKVRKCEVTQNDYSKKIIKVFSIISVSNC